MTIDDKLSSMGLELPGPAAPKGAFIPAVQTGDLLYCSGTLATINAESRYLGKLGRTVTVEEGYQSARDACLVSLGNIRRELGSLERVKRIVKLTVFVNAEGDFTDSPKVANGASELLVELFGDRGQHARSAIGVAALPGGHSVEVEMIVEVSA